MRTLKKNYSCFSHSRNDWRDSQKMYLGISINFKFRKTEKSFWWTLDISAKQTKRRIWWKIFKDVPKAQKRGENPQIFVEWEILEWYFIMEQTSKPELVEYFWGQQTRISRQTWAGISVFCFDKASAFFLYSVNIFFSRLVANMGKVCGFSVIITLPVDIGWQKWPEESLFNPSIIVFASRSQ